MSAAAVWRAEPHEADIVGQLLVDFRNHLKVDWPSDNAFLAGVDRLIEDPNTVFLLGAPDADSPPQGVAQVRFRYGIWWAAEDCLLEDLFVREDGARHRPGPRAAQATSTSPATAAPARRARRQRRERGRARRSTARPASTPRTTATAGATSSCACTSTAMTSPPELLQRLIRFDTRNPPGGERECIAFVDELLRDAGLETTIVGEDPERPTSSRAWPATAAPSRCSSRATSTSSRPRARRGRATRSAASSSTGGSGAAARST